MQFTLFLLWQIQLWAPQYPEGLVMYIWHNNIDGDVNTINGLNHYIGMKLIKVEMFPEFKILGILIAIYIAWGLLVSITGSYKLLVSYIIGDIVFVIAAIADFFVGVMITGIILIRTQQFKYLVCRINPCNWL